jgi:hypothetical protein
MWPFVHGAVFVLLSGFELDIHPDSVAASPVTRVRAEDRVKG